MLDSFLNFTADLRTKCRVLELGHYYPDADGPAAAVDRPIAEAMTCEKCGQHCTYVAYRRELPRDYVPIAGCLNCNRGYLF